MGGEDHGDKPAVTRDVNSPEEVRWLLAIWREDLQTNRGLLKPGFHAVALHRFGTWSRAQRGPMRWLTNKVYLLAYVLIRSLYGVELPLNAVVGRRLRLPHPVGVVISAQARIGDDCMIRQNVTVGQYHYGRPRAAPHAPTIGNGVWIGAGAVVVGGVVIGDGARIGPNTVVMTDVPPGGSAFSRSAEVIGPLQSQVSNGTDTPGLPTTQANGPPSPPGESIGPLSDTDVADLDMDVAEFIDLIRAAVDPDESIGPDTPLISTGIIDSFDVVALLSAVEHHFHVVIAPEEVDIESFDTPNQMLARINTSR